MSERRFRRTAAGVYSLGLHLVSCPKYRRRIVGASVAARCDEHGWQIAVKELLPDHVHVFVQVGPTDALAVVRAFKGRTARMLRHEFPYLRRFLKVSWSPSCFATSVRNVSESTVRRYIGHQWDTVRVS